jgi:hypothetical protein
MDIFVVPPVHGASTSASAGVEDDDRQVLRVTHAPIPGNTDRWLVSDRECCRELWADVPLIASYVGACLPSLPSLPSPGHSFRVSTNAGIDMTSTSSCGSHADAMHVIERVLRYMHAIQRMMRPSLMTDCAAF